LTEFTLDTSGVVLMPPIDGVSHTHPPHWRWSDLSPFAQGYVEALMRENYAELHRAAWQHLILPPDDVRVGFSDLHPEARAMILKACNAVEEVYTELFQPDALRRMGARFWERRQQGLFTLFPPLRVYLDDDGKVRLEPAA